MQWMLMAAPPIATPAPLKNSSAVNFVLSAVWIAVSLLISGAVEQRTPAAPEWAGTAFTDALLFGGFYLIARLRIGARRPLSSLGFVQRPSAGAEIGLGLILGWALTLALVLPAFLTRNLHVIVDGSRGAWLQALASALALLLSALGVQLVLTGLPFRSLVESVGPASATAVAMLMAALWSAHSSPGHTRITLALTLGTLLLCVGFLRTRALWLSLGVHVACALSLLLLFGLPVPGAATLGGAVHGAVSGPVWLTGEDLGVWASVPAIPVLLLVLVVLVRVTRDYAWHYNYEPIAGAGFPMDVPPPAEHARMEAAAAQGPAPLVQILPSVSDRATKAPD